MVAAHSTHRGKPSKPIKGGTKTTKSHRFEPFSQRVSKLKIDPVHRVRRNSFDENDGDETSSYFRASLEHWQELNLSESFTAFALRAHRLCESLPQILHYQDVIMDLLTEYISKKDELSMEPLLSLMAQFARDLGARFEKHFESAVKMVASVAATHPNVEVIEWSFTCLAWIFKFLSRLLVPDLRPVLATMSPYLGKEQQKYFVTRFAAESISFLIRKAAVVYYKDKEPLTRAATFLFEDLEKASHKERGTAAYQQGLMAMFADAIKGVNGGIHSNGIDIFRCLMDSVNVKNKEQSTLAESVLSGVLINIVHHCNPDSFSPVLDAVCEYIQTPPAVDYASATTRLSCRLIFLSLVTRKGSRVHQWKRVHAALLALLKRVADTKGLSATAKEQLQGAVAVSIQSSPMDELLPYMRPIMDAVTHDNLIQSFLPFCDMVSAMGPERFHNVVHPYFQKFIVNMWAEYEEELCVILPRLHNSHCVTSQPNKPGYLNCPKGWKEKITARFGNSRPKKNEVALLHAYTNLQGAIAFSTPPSILPELLENLHRRVSAALGPQSLPDEDLNSFSLGQGFLTYVRFATQLGQLDSTLWPLICSRATQNASVPVFLEATLAYMSSCPDRPDLLEEGLELFAEALLANISSPSHELRLLSICIFRALFSWLKIDDAFLTIAVGIENSELSLQTARKISMEVRRLGSGYSEASRIRWLDRLIPNFCFGLFSKKLASVWEDSCQAMKVICESPTGERIVAELAMSWLQSPGQPPSDVSVAEDEIQNTAVSSVYECFNVINVEKSTSGSSRMISNAKGLLIEDLLQSHRSLPLSPTSATSHALRALNAVPQVAEKRSRQIVPLFLSQLSRDDDASDPAENELTAPNADVSNEEQRNWDMQDKKTILRLFGKFINPKVLYKSSQVHDALTDLLRNGDSDVQNLALKAIFTWKLQCINPYEQNLLNLIDDARFKDELSVFVHVGQENSTIKEEHREELLPYLLRLLYGKMVARAGSRGSLGRQDGRRKAILRAISQLPDSDFGRFIQISFGPLYDVSLSTNNSKNEDSLSQDLMSPRKQLGFLNMIETMFSTLKGRMLTHATQTMEAVLYCLVRACRQIKHIEDGTTTSETETAQSSPLRNIRQVGVRCLELVFSVSPDVDWSPYIPLILTEIINPRLENFAIETAQGISGLLQLFRTWASAPKSALYFVDTPIIPHFVDTLDIESARDEVKLFVLGDIIGSLISVSAQQNMDSDGDIDVTSTNVVRSKVLGPHIEHILLKIESLLRCQPSRVIINSGVECLSKLAVFVDSSAETSRLVSTTTFLLQQPPDRVPPKTKGALLKVLLHFLPLYDQQENVELTQQIFEVLSSLFDYFKDDANRKTLSTVFDIFAARDPELREVGKLISDLNSLSSKRLDEVDFELRLATFNIINEQKFETFTPKQWRPLLYNVLYNVKDDEELAIRSSASLGVKRFIQVTGTRVQSGESAYRDLIDKVLLPSLRSGVKQNAETVRSEYVSLLGHFIQAHPTHEAVSDMCSLLADGDDEASFFNNVLHIQQHRRLRALRRLATEVRRGQVQPSNISALFFPLVEHFVFNQAEDETAHNLAAETVTTIGALSEGLTWNQFKAIFRRYKGYMQTKPGMEKNVIRLLGQLTDSLSRAMTSKSVELTTNGETMESDVIPRGSLSKSLPSESQVNSELKMNFIPFLTEFTNRRNESEVNLRLPTAVAAVKLLKLLPDEDMALLLPPLLLDVSNILRSRSQDYRDVARKTLSDIALILGPSYFGYILKELKTSLTRGYQLHVLSFTVHSMLVATTDHFKPGDLDQNLSQLGTVIMDDIFGTVGQEKDAEEYVSKMREVKSSKSYDSMELLCKGAGIRHVYNLIRPIQILLQEKLTSSLVKKIDELLRRVGIGLLRNPGAGSRDFLIFCYEVIKESYKTPDASNPNDIDRGRHRFIVQLRKRSAGRSTTSYLYKLSRFSLDVLRSVLNKHNSILTAENLAGFIPIIGDAMVQGYEEVKLSAMKLLSTIIKLPIPEMDQNSDVYLVECIKLIREAPSTNTEASQAALKLIATILRERKNTKLKDSYLAYLLQRVGSDIEEPDRQGVIFNFIRAVMSRKFMVPELYELVDKIAAMMVTNHTRSSRDLARGIYIHFLVEYPQAKSRWTKQLAYLAKNLDYRHQDGRESVMEAVHLLLSKTSGDLAQEIVSTFFIPLVMVMSNDESPNCRQMAGALLGNLFSRADSEHVKTMLTPLRNWLEQLDNLLLTSTGLQAMRIYFESDAKDKDSQVQFIVGILPRIMDVSLVDFESNEWELLFYSLQLLTKLCKLFPATMMTPKCASIWNQVLQSMRYPHAWIKSSSSNLVGMWLADEAKTNAADGFGSLPLVGSSGLKLDGAAMLQITRASMFCLKTPGVSEDLATQTIRNMTFLGRCFGQNDIEFTSEKGSEEAGDLDESDVDDEATQPSKGNKKAIQYIFEQGARVLRREPLTTRATSLVPKVACMKLIAGLSSHLEISRITPFLQTIMLPLLHLTDPSIPAPGSSDDAFEEVYKSLVTSSQEILDLLQKKLGTSDFVAQVALGREKVRERRDGRRIKRRIEAVADPEKFGRDKKRRNERKRDKRREKGSEFRDRRRGM